MLISCWASLGSNLKKAQQMTQSQFAFAQAIALQKKLIEFASKRDSKPPKGYTAEQVSKWRRSEVLSKVTALQELAGYYAEAGDIENAKQSYIQAMREIPNKGSQLEWYLVQDLADLCIKQGDEEAAFTQLYDAMVLSQWPKPEAHAWSELGAAYSRAGMDEASDRCSTRAGRLLKSNP